MRSIVGAYKLSQNDDNPSQNLFEALHVRSGRKFLAQKIPSDENLLQQLRDISIDLRHVLCREDIFVRLLLFCVQLLTRNGYPTCHFLGIQWVDICGI